MREIGLFVTSIVTADNVVTYVGNNRLFSDNVQNFSAKPFRRVDLTVQLLPGIDAEVVSMRLRQRLRQIPHLLDTPAPVIEILSFNIVGTSVAPVLAVRPCCRNEHYAPGLLRHHASNPGDLWRGARVSSASTKS